MDKLTVNKIIELNFKKGKFSEFTKSNYNLFIENINPDYRIDVIKELSISDTPVFLITSYKNKSKAAYFWCFEGAFYFKNIERTYVSFVLSDIFDFIDEFFYN